MNKTSRSISRREFLAQLSVLGSLAVSFPAAALAEMRSRQADLTVADWFKRDPWQTIMAVQEHLFPAGDDVPGASDIQAIVYLRNTIENLAADGADKDFIFNGVGWLNDLAQKRMKHAFTALSEADREILLRQIEQSRAGRNWLSLLLTYLLEALLADPVYGGNPDGMGWQWLQHQPGFPTPPENKTWYKLGGSANVLPELINSTGRDDHGR